MRLRLSGRVMQFIATVHVKMWESGEPTRKVAAKMYVTRAMKDVLTLDANVPAAL